MIAQSALNERFLAVEKAAEALSPPAILAPDAQIPKAMLSSTNQNRGRTKNSNQKAFENSQEKIRALIL
jgi:hypothetical protein